MPVIIHSREAAADTMEIMKQYAGELSGVIHCFSYSPEQAKEYVKMGFYLGIGGVVTSFRGYTEKGENLSCFLSSFLTVFYLK